MANAFLTSDNIARVATRLVSDDLNLAALVSRDLEAEFRPGGSNIVRVRVPGAVVAQTRSIFDTSTPLVSDEIAEQFINVTLSTHVYDNVVLSEGSLDLSIEDFTAQVLVPQARAIAAYIERVTATAMSAVPETTSIAYSATSPAKTLTAMRKQLRDNGVAEDQELIAVVGSGVYADLLEAETVTMEAGGKVRGFTVIESTRIPSDEIIAFVRDAFTLVVRAPEVPDGAPYGASISEGGFALRHIRSYDGTVAADRSLVSAFVAVQPMPLSVDNEDGTVSLVAHGGVVRVVTTA